MNDGTPSLPTGIRPHDRDRRAHGRDREAPSRRYETQSRDSDSHDDASKDAFREIVKLTTHVTSLAIRIVELRARGPGTRDPFGSVFRACRWLSRLGERLAIAVLRRASRSLVLPLATGKFVRQRLLSARSGATHKIAIVMLMGSWFRLAPARVSASMRGSANVRSGCCAVGALIVEPLAMASTPVARGKLQVGGVARLSWLGAESPRVSGRRRVRPVDVDHHSSTGFVERFWRALGRRVEWAGRDARRFPGGYHGADVAS